VFSPSGKEIRLWRDETQAYVINRTTFDRSIAEKAQNQGAKYFIGCRVKSIEVVDGRVEVKTEEGAMYQAKAAAIASGFYSRIPQQLGLGRVGDFVVGAQAEVEASNLDEIEVYFDQRIAPGFFAWMVPTMPRHALVAFLSKKAGRAPAKSVIKALSRGQDRVHRCQYHAWRYPTKTAEEDLS
jgi:flavin-dependent dehydrogenase